MTTLIQKTPQASNDFTGNTCPAPIEGGQGPPPPTGQRGDFGRAMCCVASEPYQPNFGNPNNYLDSSPGVPKPLIGQSTMMLASYLGSGGQSGGLNPLYRSGGPRSIQLALRLQF